MSLTVHLVVYLDQAAQGWWTNDELRQVFTGIVAFVDDGTRMPESLSPASRQEASKHINALSEFREVGKAG